MYFRKIINLFFLAASSIALLSLPYFLGFLSSDLQEQEPVVTIAPQADKQQPDIVIKGLVLANARLNKTYNVTLHAQENRLLNGSDLISCINITCTIHNKKNHPTFLTAQHALIDRTKKLVVFSDNVTGDYKDLHLKGKLISYDFEQHIISTSQPLHCTHPHFSLTAQQCEINSEKNTITMSHGVYTEFFTKLCRQQ